MKPVFKPLVSFTDQVQALLMSQEKVRGKMGYQGVVECRDTESSFTCRTFRQPGIIPVSCGISERLILIDWGTIDVGIDPDNTKFGCITADVSVCYFTGRGLQVSNRQAICRGRKLQNALTECLERSILLPRNNGQQVSFMTIRLG